MSISLTVAGYCQNCPYFEAVTDTTLLKAAEEDTYIHTVRCENAGKCVVIVDHLKKTPLLFKDFNVPKEKNDD